MEPELALSFVSNTITDIEYCTDADVSLQHVGGPKMRPYSAILLSCWAVPYLEWLNTNPEELTLIIQAIFEK